MVEFDELLVTTGVDALVRLVKQSGRIELTEAAKELKIPIDTLEDWARVLEEEGILRVQYKLTRVYLVWVTPTEEEVVEERESFYKEKAELGKEITQVKKKIKPQIEEMATLKGSFAKFYKDVYVKLDEMEKKLSPTVVSGAVSEHKFRENAKQMSDMLQNIRLLRENMKTLKTDIALMEKSMKKSKSAESFEKMKKLEGEISSLMTEMAGLKNKMAKETEALTKGVAMPNRVEMQKKFDTLVKGFSEVKRRNAELREDLRNLKESKEIVDMVGKELRGYDKNTAALKKDLIRLSKQADKLFEKSKEVNEKFKGNLDTIERFSDSLDIAKSIITKFPSQKKLSDELKQLSKKEKEIEEKTMAVKKLLEMVGGKQLSTKRASALAHEIDEKLAELKHESEALTSELETDKSTYLAFQQVKERIVPSIEKYNKEISRLETELEKTKGSAFAQQKQLKEEAKKFKETVKGKEISKMVQFAENIKEKKKTLDEVKNSLGSLADTADNINKRLVLLSREAKLLELRTAGAPAAAEKEKIVKEQLKLTKAEEMEFRRKRDELKKLIKKLWEEQ